MNIWDDSFQAIKEGWKNIEMRLNDKKRSIIKVNDIVVFTNSKTKEEMKCNVINIFKYSNFEELYKNHNKLSIGYKENESANSQDMLDYYSIDKIKENGVIGIEIQVIEENDY
ncbi:MAG: ASCH domain-containing protein [Bacilli bacterium]